MAESLDLSRRQFVVLAAGCAAVCACGGAIAAPASKPVEPFEIGNISEYVKDGVYDKFAKSHQILVYREDGQIYASTAVCPHRGASLKLKDGLPYCSKHGSMFSHAGTVTKGPAKSSLERYAITKSESGQLTVDANKSFRESQWNDPASFVKVS